MLDLRYGLDVPAAVAEMLEHHARSIGLPLADIELVGRDLATAEAFICAAERGFAAEFASATVEGRPWTPATDAPHMGVTA